MTAALETRQLVAGYEPDLPIVRGIDFAVTRGELVVVLGPNGAGKSTFIKAIAGLVPVHGGSVLLGGTDITAAAAHEKITQGLGFVPQTENIFTTMSIAENLQLAADLLPRSRQGQRIAHVLAMFPDLATRTAQRAGQLSGGQRQMLAVARALVVEPQVLILDEPSAGLSPKVAQDVFTDLRAINRAGVTVILVEQNVKSALAIADRGVILVDGELRHEGPAAALVNDPRLGELFLRGHKPAQVAS